MTRLGQAVALSALAREESRGTHYRADFPVKNLPEWECQHLIGWEGGELALSRRKLDLPLEVAALRSELE